MEIKHYLSLIWRWAWLIVLGAVIAATATYFYNDNQTPVYQASSTYIIDRAPGSGTGNDYAQTLVEQTLTQSYVRMVNTRPVRLATIEQLGLNISEGQMRGKISISVVPETQLITIRVEDTIPERAADIANTVGFVFIEQNQERENTRYAQPISNWEKRLVEIGDEIEALEIQINEMGDEETASAEELAEISRLNTKLNEAQIRYTDAFNNLNALQVAQAQESSNLIVIEEAQVPSNPIRPNTRTNTMLAAVIGAMLAVGLIFLIDYLDDTIKTPQEVLEDTNLTTLGTIAMIKGENLSERLITAQSPRDPISEAYRVLRTNLNFSAVDGKIGKVLITSSSPGEGKSTTAANLAVVIAQTGKRVILVDADLRRPIQHKIFKVANNQGLTTAILDNNTPVAYHLQKTKFPELQIMTSGPIPPNPAELLNSQRMNQVMEEFQREADVMIFDTPPILTVADATILAPRADGSLIVVESGGTRRSALLQATERMENTNAHMFGVVINKLNPGRIRGYGYYYKYHYYYSSMKEYGRNPRKKGRRWLPGFIRR